MKTLIIYDEEGMVISVRSGDPLPQEPAGVPFIWAEIPKGKRLKITDGIGVDTSTLPHEPILEDIPPSETDNLKNRVFDLETRLMIGGM